MDDDVAGSAQEALLEGVWGGGGIAAQALAERVADSTGEDRDHHVEIDVERDCGGEGVDVEGTYPLGEALLDAHAVGVLLDQDFGPGVEVVGDENGGLLVPEAMDGELADLAVVVAEPDVVVVVNSRPAVAVGALKLDGAPGRAGQLGELFEQRGPPGAQGNEADTALVELAEGGAVVRLESKTSSLGSSPLSLRQWSQKAMTSWFWSALSRSALAWTML